MVGTTKSHQAGFPETCSHFPTTITLINSKEQHSKVPTISLGWQYAPQPPPSTPSTAPTPPHPPPPAHPASAAPGPPAPGPRAPPRAAPGRLPPRPPPRVRRMDPTPPPQVSRRTSESWGAGNGRYGSPGMGELMRNKGTVGSREWGMVRQRGEGMEDVRRMWN